jgi:hypothetical protein
MDRILSTSKLCAWFLVACAVPLAACMGDVTDEDPSQAAVESNVTTSPTTLVRKGSGKCLDVSGSSTANGAKIQQWGCNGTNAQSFTLEDRGGGAYRVRNASSNKCLDVTDGGTSDGTKVQQYTCSSSSNQKFRVEDLGGGYSRLVNTRSSKCLDVNGASPDDGAQVQIWSCNGTDAQSWKLGGGSNPPPPPPPPPGGDGLTWRRANLTNFTSYPEPGSDECDNFNGCMWAGQFAFVDGKQTEDWVRAHDILAVHSRDAGTYKLKTLRLKQGSKQIDAVVYDMCSDSDCSGCCTQNANAGGVGFLIDIEDYTMQRFGSGDGVVDWACVNCN